MPTYYGLAQQGFYEPWKILGDNLAKYQSRKLEKQRMAQQQSQFDASHALRQAAEGRAQAAEGRAQSLFDVQLPPMQIASQEAQRAQKVRELGRQTALSPQLQLPLAQLPPQDREAVSSMYKRAMPDITAQEIAGVQQQQVAAPGLAPAPEGMRYLKVDIDPTTGQPTAATAAPRAVGPVTPQVQLVNNPQTGEPIGSIINMTDPQTGETKQQWVADAGDQAKALTEAQTNSTMHSGRMLFNNALYDMVGGDAEMSSRAATVLKFMPENFRSQDLKGSMGAMGGFITSVLRRESGAAISKDEFKRYAREFFPMPGDGQDVVLQKRYARALATDLMISSAGPGAQGARDNAAARLQAFAQAQGTQVPPEVLQGITGALKQDAPASAVNAVAQVLNEAASTPRRVTSAEEVMAMPLGAIGIDDKGNQFIIREMNGKRTPVPLAR